MAVGFSGKAVAFGLSEPEVAQDLDCSAPPRCEGVPRPEDLPRPRDSRALTPMTITAGWYTPMLRVAEIERSIPFYELLGFELYLADPDGYHLGIMHWSDKEHTEWLQRIGREAI